MQVNKHKNLSKTVFLLVEATLRNLKLKMFELPVYLVTVVGNCVLYKFTTTNGGGRTLALP